MGINDNLLNLFADVLDDITKKHDEKYKTKEDKELELTKDWDLVEELN